MSSLSKAQIFNLTLNALGISNPIEKTSMQSSQAILLNNFYDVARDYVLKDFDWNFASCYKELSLVKKDKNDNYMFDYPNDCVFAREVFDVNTNTCKKFSICCDENEQKLIMTDTKTPLLRYTKRIEKEIFFTSEFSMALAYYLASITSDVLTGSIQKGQYAWEKYKAILSRAKVINAQEGSDILFDDTTYINSRD